MRGHGQSADPGPNYVWSVDDLLNDMKGFLDALGLDRVHYVGESLGGILGVAFAARCPERFKTMTLISPPEQSPQPGAGSARIGVRPRREYSRQMRGFAQF